MGFLAGGKTPTACNGSGRVLGRTLLVNWMAMEHGPSSKKGSHWNRVIFHGQPISLQEPGYTFCWENHICSLQAFHHGNLSVHTPRGNRDFYFWWGLCPTIVPEWLLKPAFFLENGVVALGYAQTLYELLLGNSGQNSSTIHYTSPKTAECPINRGHFKKERMGFLT